MSMPTNSQRWRCVFESSARNTEVEVRGGSREGEGRREREGGRGGRDEREEVERRTDIATCKFFHKRGPYIGEAIKKEKRERQKEGSASGKGREG